MIAIISFVVATILVLAMINSVVLLMTRSTKRAMAISALSMSLWSAWVALSIIAFIIGAEVSVFAVIAVAMVLYVNSQVRRMSLEETSRLAKIAIAMYVMDAVGIFKSVFYFGNA